MSSNAASPSRFAAWIDRARAKPIPRAAIVHPCSKEALVAAREVIDEGLFAPLLVGPLAKMKTACAAAGLDADQFAFEPVEHSHAAAARAVDLAARGVVDVLVKGSLHSDELLEAVVAPDSGLHTGRRISHVFLMDIPRYHKLLVITDAAVNIQPSLMHKRDICQNPVDFVTLFGVAQPRVAILAAIETINPEMPATLDAAALAIMAHRGQITGAVVDGPLAFDNAINLAAAETKGICSAVAGDADILLVPDLEAGNMLAKQLIYLGGAESAGLVLGARVPIVLTSRSDSLAARIASAAFAKLICAARQFPAAPT